MFSVQAEICTGPGDENFCKDFQGWAVLLACTNLIAFVCVPWAGQLSHVDSHNCEFCIPRSVI